MRLRRSELSTPGSSDKMLEKAPSSEADFVFLDLEDAVAPSEKVAARAKVVNALRTADWGRKTRAVRINNVETEWCYEDIIHVVEEAGEFLDVIIIPKVKTAEDVRWVDTLITQIERKRRWERRIGLEVLIEEVEAMINAAPIAKSTPRLEALIFGPGDYSASQGVRPEATGGVSKDYPGDVWHYARNQVVIAARAAGIDAVDGPFADFRDEEGYRRECTRAAVLGFSGKWCIHPSQIEIANRMFAPLPDEIAQAKAAIEAVNAAEAQGLGSANLNGMMIDAATARLFEVTLDRARQCGLL